jgi:hypothetical protein
MQLVPEDFAVDNPRATAMSLQVNNKLFYLEHMPDDTQQLVFDLEVINEGSTDFLFSPERTRIYMSNIPFPTEPVRNVTEQSVVHIRENGGRAAVKPRSAKQVNDFIRKRIQAQRAMQVVMLVAGAALVVSDVVQDANDASKEVVTQRDVNRSIMRDVATASSLVALDVIGGEVEQQIIKKQEDLEYLPDEYFNEVVLLPGRRSRGKVFFPANENYVYYRIIIPVDQKGYIFDFRRPKAAERRAMRTFN